MMKRFFTMFFALVLLFSCTLTVGAQDLEIWKDIPRVDNTQYAYDFGGYLTDEEIQILSDKAQRITQEYGMSTVVLITNDTLGLSTEDYGDGFYEVNNYNIDGDYSGAILVVNMQDRKFDIYSYDRARRLFTVDNMDYVIDRAVEPMRESPPDIYSAADTFLNETESLYYDWQIYIANGGSEDYTITEVNTTTNINIFEALGGGVLLSVLVVGIMLFLHSRTLPGGISGENYSVSSNTNIYHRTDNFHSTRTSRVRKSDSNNSGGGGRSFSGGSSSGSTSSGRGSSRGSRSF